MLALEHSRDSRIVTVSLNRPERRNALSASLVGELDHVIRSLANDHSVRVIVVTGTGKAFSAGADLDALHKMQSASVEDNLKDSRLLARLFLAIRSSPKVVIAKINGHAIAGGCGLAAACDVAVSVDSAKFGFTEVRIGFVPALVSALLSDRILGADRRELFLRGHLIDAQEALRMKLINHVVTEEELDASVERLAVEISRNTSMNAIARTKALLLGDLEQRLDQAAILNAEARSDSECKDGVESFLSRRDPMWVRQWEKDHTDPA